MEYINETSVSFLYNSKSVAMANPAAWLLRELTRKGSPSAIFVGLYPSIET
jgi:hypothetical protein